MRSDATIPDAGLIPRGRSIARIFAVVVVYKMLPGASSTLRTLLAAAAKTSRKELDLEILIWDNTPGGQDPGELPNDVLYVSAPDNPGLAVAYNHALKLAGAEDYEWLLTLDQDSILPEHFLERIAGLVGELGPQERVGAIVPQVIADGRNISPFRFLWGAWPSWFQRGHVGISKRAAYAANSGATLRVSALRAIHGYDPMFPLDLSDTSVFHRLHESGKRVFIAGDLSLLHDFALLNKRGRMSLERYDASLLDDCAFWDIHMGTLARVERILRFAVRACKESLRPGDALFRQRTLLELKRRVMRSRKSRIMEWKQWAALRRDNLRAGPIHDGPAVRASAAQFPPVTKR
jgi:GT2 family glycosyltransferase